MGLSGTSSGSPYEHAGLKSKRFPLFGPASTFTDDSVLTAAVAESISRKPFGMRSPSAAMQTPEACIAGSIAEAFYGGVPSRITSEAKLRLDEGLLDVVERFRVRYVVPRLTR